jgi:hypothetical protein
MATKLKSVRAENFRGLSLIEYAPTETVVRLTGPNACGKTTGLLAVLSVADPNAADGDPVSYGESEAAAEFTVELESGGTLTARRRWYTTKAGKRATEIEIVRIEGGETTSYKDSKAILARLFGPFVDVRQFLNVRTPTQERELAGALLKAAGVSVVEADAAIEEATEARRTAKANLASAEARLGATPKPRPGLPDAEVSVADRANEIAGWRTERQTHEAARLQFESARQRVETASEFLAGLRVQVAKAEADLKARQAEADTLDASLAAMPEPPSASSIEDAERALVTAERTNVEIRSAVTYRELSAEVASLAKKAAASESAVDKARTEKLGLLAKAKMPVDGLVITEDGSVTYEGVGLHELSEGQKLVVGCAIAIATRGSLSAIFVDGGESIDAKNEAKAVAMCEAAGVRVILAETVKAAGELVIRGAAWSVGKAEAAA